MHADVLENELVVVMRRAIYIKLHQTDLPIFQSVLEHGCWGSVMTAAMREHLHAKIGGR